MEQRKTAMGFTVKEIVPIRFYTSAMKNIHVAASGGHEQVCSLVGAYSSECTSLIDQYGPVALTLLVAQLVSLDVHIEYVLSCYSYQHQSLAR